MYFSIVLEYWSDPDPSLFIIHHIITTGINKYLHTLRVSRWEANVTAKVLKWAQYGVFAFVCVSEMCAHRHALAISSAYTQSRTQALERLRCRASSKAQCRQCARCAAFNRQRCATGPSGLPNSLPQHCGKWSLSLLNGEGGTGGGRRRGWGKECEGEIKNEGKVHYSPQWKKKKKGKEGKQGKMLAGAGGEKETWLDHYEPS